MSQLVSATGPELYRVVGDRFFSSVTRFCFSVCEDRERLIAARGREEWKNQPYPINLEHSLSSGATGGLCKGCLEKLMRQLNETESSIAECIRKRLQTAPERHCLQVLGGDLLRLPNHPSQKQHDCVWGIPDYFSETKFEQLTETVD